MTSNLSEEEKKERQRQAQKEWRKNNPEKLREYQKRWREKNKEKVAAYNKKWRTENREAWNKIVNRYRKKQRSTDDYYMFIRQMLSKFNEDILKELGIKKMHIIAEYDKELRKHINPCLTVNDEDIKGEEEITKYINKLFEKYEALDSNT